jgi:prevent-host-death family protein
MIWQLQEAKSKFSQLVRQALSEGPQIVTRHGEEVAVVLSIDDYRRLSEPRPSLLELLLDSPLRGSGLELERDQEDYGRKAAL